MNETDTPSKHNCLYAMLAVTVFSLSGCAGQLGNLRYQSIKATSVAPSVDGKPLPYREYFKVNVSTPDDITRYFSECCGIYAHAQFCHAIGNKSNEKIISFGPYKTNKKSEYHIYLVANHPDKGRKYDDTFMDEYLPYNLRLTDRDVCVWLSAPRYPMAAKSKQLRIPPEAFSREVTSR